ncbi:Acyl-CoA-binding domain-containing protein 3 [Taenia crassiceps]|uniref:Acyl-CoA-binding domain-containing protein 3 n=1 Tax=Taenia crassiceps TaxID=6207 RepID=A0ABR4QNG0_9CEST
MDFPTAAAEVQTLPYCSDDDKLYLYGLYKQATVGDVNTGEGQVGGLERKKRHVSIGSGAGIYQEGSSINGQYKILWVLCLLSQIDGQIFWAPKFSHD